MISLAIEASTYEGSVAIVRDGSVLAERVVAMRGVESEALMPALDGVLGDAEIGARQLNRILCGGGPGSFTSLRIAASLAKGLALGLDLPLYAVPSLGLMVGAPDIGVGRYVATLDALRGEWYAGTYQRGLDGQVVDLAPTRVVDRAGIDAIACGAEAAIVGAATGATFRSPRASAVTALEGQVERSSPVDRGRWEPLYGRLAEAQVKWEALHGRPLPSA